MFPGGEMDVHTFAFDYWRMVQHEFINQILCEGALLLSAREWAKYELCRVRVRPFRTLYPGRSQSTISGIRLKTRRCDCSFVRTVPVQTSVGKLLVDHFDVRMKC